MKDFLRGVNIYLIGLMGAGKSTIGQLLAKELGYRFFDTDVLIEQVAGQTISEIFEREGEEGFRQVETQVLAQLSAYKNLAIATGGGIVLRRENWSYLQHGIVVWLDVPVQQLQERLKEDTTRPLLQDADPAGKLQALWEQRRSLYAQADVQVAFVPGETPPEVANRVLNEIRKVLKSEVSSIADTN